MEPFLYNIAMIIGGSLFILGLVFGSFLNAWEYRIENNKTLKGRSLCPKCEKQIAWFDNIPLVSWLLLRGRCRQCHKSISIQYPAIELLTAIVFLFLWLYSSPGQALSNWFDGIYNLQFTIYNQFPIFELIKLLLLLSYFSLLILVGLHDAKTKYVLTKHVYLALAIGSVYTLLNFGQTWNIASFYNYLFPYILSALLPAGILWLISKISKERAMGYGDADIALATGFVLGWPRVSVGYYLAFIPAALYGILLLLLKKGNMKSEVPLGPFLIAGASLAFLYGQQIFDWYARIFLGI